MTEQPLAVVITKPGFDTVRVGPFHYEHQARSFAHSLEFRAFQTVRPEGTTVEVAAYEEQLPHTPVPSRDSYENADLMNEETGHGEAAYPDQFTRIVAHFGYDDAVQIWRAACNAYDFLYSGNEA